MGWSKGYDFVNGETRLFSATTNVQENGDHELLLRGLGPGDTHLHVFHAVADGSLGPGGTRLTAGGAHVGPNVSLSTESRPLVARIAVTYAPGQPEPAVQFLEFPHASGISSTAWSAVAHVKRTPWPLPGAYGQSGVYAVRLCPADTAPSSHATIAPFGPTSPVALQFEWHPRGALMP